jgi:hypothetical protein
MSAALDIYQLVAGRQGEILAALGIKLNGRRHIRCPFPGHADQHPSWRWDAGKGRYFCTCGSGDIIGAVMKARDLDWRGAADYCRDVLGEPPFRANGRDHNRDRGNGSSAPPIAPVETPKTVTPDEWRRPPTSFPAPSIERARFMTREALTAPDVMREHEYRQGGVPVFIKQRINGGNAKFRPFWRVDDRGDTWQNIAPDGFKMLPYVAPGRDPFTAGDDRPLFWCEGERDVDTLAALGLDAFTFGAAAHAPPGAELYVKGRNLVIPLDNDPAGQRDVAAKVRCATGHAATIKAISFPELASGGDVTDYLAAHGVDNLLKRVAEAKPAAEPTRSKSGLATVCAAAVEPETIDFLWDRRIARGKHTCIAGEGGLGKSQLFGGAAFTTAPRAAFAVIEDPDDPDRRLFLHLKNNLGPKPQGLAFRLEQRLVGSDKKTGEDIVASRVAWETQPVTVTADEAMGAQKDPTAKDDASDFLRTVLAGGPVKVLDLEQEARDAGLLGEDQRLSQSKPFRSAREVLGIKPYQPKGVKAGGWMWALPDEGI